jgi:hypothetical protein
MPRTSRVLAFLAFSFVLLASSIAQAQESWDVIHVQGQRIGFLHVSVEPVADKANRKLVRVRVDWDLTFKRGNDPVHLTQQWGTIEKPDGTILRLDVITKPGEMQLRTSGDVKDGVMNLKITGGGNTQIVPIRWTDDIRGPYGAELSLAKKMMEPKETREIKIFVPDVNKVCFSKLEAGEFEDVKLGPQGENRKLLKIIQTVSELDRTPKPEMTATLWVDEAGQILKTHSEMLEGTDFYRTTKAGAMAGNGVANFNLLAASIVKCRDLVDSDKLRDVVYTVTAKNDDVATLFPDDVRQKITPGKTKETGLLEVKTSGTDSGEAIEAPAPEFLRPNALINSDDARVKAVAIQSWVAKNVNDKNFNIAFAPAAEVARNLSGDCSEHSVLTAAMCRAAGIPSRCVVGLVYARNQGGFGPHMWNEVYVNRRWVAIDSAFDQSEVDATHITLSTTSLDGVSPFDAFTPVLKVFGGMKIEPKEIR